MTKLGSIRVLSFSNRGSMRLSKRTAPRLSDKARQKIRKADNARAEIARKAATIRMG
jgi:hypothetical protein